MTHNIVAQFSCSVNENGDLKVYRAVSGSIFKDEYTETLDSGTLVLSQVSKEDRLSNIKAYDFVHVFDASGKTNFDKIYLVDSFEERENNIKDHIFGYTINLMSETKLLEKIQCPNLTITHKVDNGAISKKTIFEKIKEYMELFVPKIKFSEDDENWNYYPLIKLPYRDFHTGTSGIGHIEGNEFTQAGDEWELSTFITWSSAEPNININEVEESSITVTQISESGIRFNHIWVTYDSVNKGFSINATVLEEPSPLWDGSIDFSFTFYSTTTEFYKKFSVPCADFSFTSPTLRQVLTTLMQQVGCIPIVKNRTLGFLDLQKEPTDFGNGDYTVNNTVNNRRKSLSSDSFVNTLVNTSSQVLDSGNKVVCEALGFRDWNKAILKQEENLYLQTKFPIYNVEKFVANAYVETDITIRNLNSGIEGSAGGSDHIARWSIGINKRTDTFVVLDFAVSFNYDTNTLLRIEGTFVAFSYKTDNIRRFNISRTINGNTFNPGTDDRFSYTVGENYNKFFFYGILTVIDGTGQAASGGFDVFYSNFSKANIKFLCLYSQDITTLLVEKSVRQNLSPDFTAMVSETSGSATPTLSTLAKYVYGTLEYEIGSTKISGFSESYDIGSSTITGWIQVNYTYFENIWNFIIKYYNDSIKNEVLKSLGNFPIMDNGTYTDGNRSPGTIENFVFNSAVPYNPYNVGGQGLPRIFSTGINFTYFWFDISYQPLNSFNLAYVKSQEELDYPLEQYDGNASGLTDFDRLSIHEQEQVDRIGNETFFIAQRTTNYEDIQNFENGPLVFRDDVNRDGLVDSDDNSVDYIIFKRSFSINNYCFNVDYVGSKDSILKNYFTSIRTKYRAYQYVDYSQSVLRKERDTFFVRISEEDFYDGDDNVFFGYFDEYNLENQYRYFINFLGDWTYSTTGATQNLSHSFYFGIPKYCVLSDENEQTKNDISIISTKNFFALITEEIDNVGSGTYFDTNALQQALTNRNALLGGVPQTWQIWQEEYNESHIVSYVSDLKIKNIFDDYIDISTEATQDIMDDMSKIMRLPLLDSTFVDLFNEGSNNVVFSIVDNNKSIESPNYKKTFYKDYAETINYTVQFVYYSTSKNIIWNEGFFNLNGISGSLGVPGTLKLVSLEGKEFKLEEGEYTDSIEYIDTPYSDIVTFRNGIAHKTNPYIQIYWRILSTCTQFKVVSVYGTIKRDIIGFKYNGSSTQKFYVSLNDTKTDYVLAEQDGVLYRKYKVQTYDKSQIINDTVLEYIQNSGAATFYLDIFPTQNCSFEIKYTDVNTSGDNNVFGNASNSSPRGIGVYGENSGISVVNQSAKTTNFYRIGRSNHTYIIRANYTSDLKGVSIIKDLTDGKVFRGQQTGQAGYSSGNGLYAFCLNSSSVHRGMKLHYLKIWNDGVLVGDFVPISGGLYNRVNNTVYRNSNSGTIIGGPEVEQTAYPRKIKNIYND